MKKDPIPEVPMREVQPGVFEASAITFAVNELIRRENERNERPLANKILEQIHQEVSGASPLQSGHVLGCGKYCNGTQPTSCPDSNGIVSCLVYHFKPCPCKCHKVEEHNSMCANITHIDRTAIHMSCGCSCHKKPERVTFDSKKGEEAFTGMSSKQDKVQEIIELLEKSLVEDFRIHRDVYVLDAVEKLRSLTN